MTREEKRNAVVSRCRAVLMIATKSADERRERAYNAYGWARDKMLGMASGFWAIHELELEELAPAEEFELEVLYFELALVLFLGAFE